MAESQALTAALIAEGLSEVRKTPKGDGWAFSKLALPGRKIKLIEADLGQWKNLRTVDLSENELDDVGKLSALAHLLNLDIRGNLLTTLGSIGEQKSLSVINVDNNKVETLVDLKAPSVRKISAANNLFKSSIELGEMREAKWIDLTGNQLQSFLGFSNCTCLESLILNSNGISDLASLNQLPLSLRSLFVKKNNITSLGAFSSANLPNLMCLDISENKLPDLDQATHLANLPSLREVTFTGNEAMYANHEEDFAKEILVKLPNINKIDGVIVTYDLRVEAAKLRKEREAADDAPKETE